MSQRISNGLNVNDVKDIKDAKDASASKSDSSSSSSSDESNSMTAKKSSPDYSSDTSCKDTDNKKSSPESSNVEDTDAEDIPENKTEIKTDVKTDVKTDTQVEAEPTPIPRLAPMADSYLSDHNNFADCEDSSSANAMKYSTLLENFRYLKKPKEVDLGEVINRRKTKRRTMNKYMGGRNSPKERFEQRRRQQRVTAVGEPYPTRKFRVRYSDTSEQSVGSDTGTETGFSSGWLSESEYRNIQDAKRQSIASATEESAISLDKQVAKTTDEPKVLEPVSKGLEPVPEGLEPVPQAPESKASEGTKESSQGAGRKRPRTLPSTQRDECSILSPLPTTPEEPENPSQYVPSVVLAESLEGNPHYSRVNTLATLIDSIEDFMGHMENTQLPSVHGSTSSSGAEAPPLLVRCGRHSRVLRHLEEDFKRRCSELESRAGVNVKEEACNDFLMSVRYLRDRKRLETDEMSYFSHTGHIVPQSSNPVSLGEIEMALPGIWNTLMMNNQLMSQWTFTLLDWCLHATPECHPQHFYDAETGVRALQRNVAEAHSSLNNLLSRWRSRSMVDSVLGQLTYMITLSNHAVMLFSTLETEVVNIRFNLGTRQVQDPGNRQRTDSEDTLSVEPDTPERKKGKKE